ncbi:hypothetical protein CK203_042803 [Vitis vinifera]|uniref:Uncharacterized protein n=1 Tax=Vitis vinifera TaxID=29760 RepID=A0A438HQR4_VITVI|nr:hypothetical protein CK203_042803 [Vitis vinifera]
MGVSLRTSILIKNDLIIRKKALGPFHSKDIFKIQSLGVVMKFMEHIHKMRMLDSGRIAYFEGRKRRGLSVLLGEILTIDVLIRRGWSTTNKCNLCQVGYVRAPSELEGEGDDKTVEGVEPGSSLFALVHVARRNRSFNVEELNDPKLRNPHSVSYGMVQNPVREGICFSIGFY